MTRLRFQDWGNESRQRAHNEGVMRALYADLVDRMTRARDDLLAAAPTRARSRTGDEDLGHEFHGNQWTGGLGSKPKEIKAKTSKAGMHELLSSGHPFSKAELMAIAGVKTDKLFSDYIAMLKNPKYAGSAGALSIQKKGEHYFVAMPDGTPAPGIAIIDGIKEGNDLTDMMLLAEHEESDDVLKNTPYAAKPLPPHLQKLAAKMDKPAPSHTITEVHVPGISQPDPNVPTDYPDFAAWQAAQVEAGIKKDPYISAVAALSGAHPGSMTKADADKHYQEALTAANIYMGAGIDGHKEAGHAAVLKWKKQKAAAMAAWAQAVHGHIGGPKPQQLFKADEKLASDLAAGMSLTAAVAQWKMNTAAEKNGNFPAKAVPAPSASQGITAAAKKAAALAPAEPVFDMGHAAPVEQISYDSLVPEHAEPIGFADFAEEKGAWTKGIARLRSDLLAESANAVNNKKGVEEKLRDRLKDKPNFQALVKRLGIAKSGYASLEAKLIGAWAGSSGDTHDISVALQMAVRDAFGIPDGHIEKAALGSLKQHGGDVDSLTKQAIQSLNSNITPLKPHEVQTARAALQEFVQAQHAETQEFLASKGHEFVYVARGMKFDAGHNNAHGPANLKLQPASSFSANYSTAKSFSGHGTVFLTKVPRQQVLSTYMTGFGCTSEHEVVVIAHNKLKAFTMGPSAGVTGSIGAGATIHAQIKSQLSGVSTPKTVAATKAASKAPALNESHAAGLKKAVINAKSKAYKAGKVAAGKPSTHPKAIHAAKAAQEAEAAVKALQAFKSGGGFQ